VYEKQLMGKLIERAEKTRLYVLSATSIWKHAGSDGILSCGSLKLNLKRRGKVSISCHVVRSGRVLRSSITFRGSYEKAAFAVSVGKKKRKGKKGNSRVKSPMVPAQME